MKQRLAALAPDVILNAVQGLELNTMNRDQAIKSVLNAVLQGV